MIGHQGPEPLQHLLARRQVAKNRAVFCTCYERCLDEALQRRWVSWTCARCARFAVLRQGELVALGHSA